jgi:8-oxo-dGTP pyrophosphatase MutT (NUDIX family)
MLRLVYLAYQVYCFFFRPLTLGVRVMLIKDGNVLLVRHTYLDGWFMPGGGVKRGETLDQAARREALEEVGAQLNEISLIGAYSHFLEWKSDHNILFFSNDFTLNGGHDREIAEVRFFPLDKLPENLYPSHRRRLEEYRAGSKPEQFGEW